MVLSAFRHSNFQVMRDGLWRFGFGKVPAQWLRWEDPGRKFERTGGQLKVICG